MRKWAFYTIPSEKRENRFPNALSIRRTLNPAIRNGEDVASYGVQTFSSIWIWEGGIGVQAQAGCSLARDDSGLRKGGPKANLDLESAPVVQFMA